MKQHALRTLAQRSLCFARHFGRPPEKIGPEEIRSFQVYMTTEKKLAPGTIAISNAALRFLYNVTLQRHWVLEEVLPMPQIPDTLPVFSALKKFWSLKFS